MIHAVLSRAGFVMSAFADYRKIAQIALPFVAALLLASATRVSARAEESQKANHMLIIPASDGYDFDDCLSGGKTCGRTIADAWCEAHGMSASISFGRADDVTAAIPKADGAQVLIEKAAITPKLAPGSFIVNCRD